MAQHVGRVRQRGDVPSVQPDTPWLSLPLSGIGRQGSILTLEPPEEECVVWKPRAVDGDAPGPVSADVERDIRECLRDLEVYSHHRTIRPCTAKKQGRLRTLLPFRAVCSRGYARVVVGP
jgi:hypothetical protein